MKNNKKILITIGVVILFVLVICLIIFISKGTKKTLSLEELAKTDIKEFTNLVISGGTKNELKEISGLDKFWPQNIMTGKDSYLNKKPNDKFIKSNNLTSYVDKSEKYIDNFEKKLEDNYVYKIKGVYINKGQAQVVVTLIPYYYSVYMCDLDNLQKKLLMIAGSNDKISKYKSKVKAMEILNSHLDDYINKDNKIKTAVLYDKNNSAEMQNSFNSYLIALNGSSHNNEIINSLYQNSNERVEGYIASATENGTLIPSDILALK